LLASEQAIGEVFNVGATEEITILDLAHRILERTGSSSPIQFIPYEAAYARGFEDMHRRVPDTSKIEASIGWRPRFTLEDILTDVIADVRSRAERESTSVRTVDERTRLIDVAPAGSH
jgi:UDP-glucose 4-epimerase